MRLVCAALIATVSAGCVIKSSGGSGSKPSSTSPTAPPRHTSGPVRLAVFRPTAAAALAGGFDVAKFNDSWRAQFDGQAGIDIVSQDKTDKAERHAAKGKFDSRDLGFGAVRLYCEIGTVKKTGYDPRQKKVVEATCLKYTATLEGPEDGRSETATVEGNLFQNEQMLKDLAEKVRRMLRG